MRGQGKNDFTQGSVAGAILRMAGPMTLAQLINILYNVVDRMYIGRIPGEGRLALWEPCPHCGEQLGPEVLQGKELNIVAIEGT